MGKIAQGLWNETLLPPEAENENHSLLAGMQFSWLETAE